MNKYVCPECGSQLLFWEEFVFDKQRLINTKTGMLNKRVHATAGNYCGTNGLVCTRCDFTYSGSASNNVEYDILNEIFESIKEV